MDSVYLPRHIGRSGKVEMPCWRAEQCLNKNWGWYAIMGAETQRFGAIAEILPYCLFRSGSFPDEHESISANCSHGHFSYPKEEG